MDVENPEIMYVVKDDEYIFPTLDYNICLIDFSRSIILPDKIQDLRNSSLQKSHEIKSNVNEIHMEQSERLLKLYLKFTDDSRSNEDELICSFGDLGLDYLPGSM